MDIMISIITFIIGCLIGWFINHWYSVVMRRPSLRQSGSGTGSNFRNSGYHYNHITISNELRTFTLKIPETVILGKRIKTHFGNQIVEREPATQCTARLLEKSGKYICHLWWTKGNDITPTTEISSGNSTSLLLFLRREDNENKYFVYQPKSQTDFSPKTSRLPTFTKTMHFFVEVSYSHGSQKLTFPVSIVIGYDGNFSFETDSSSGSF